MVADAAAGPAGPPPLALQGGVGVRRLAGAAGRRRARRCRRPRSSTSASARRYWIEDWAALRPARRGRRPGALRPRVGRAARATPPSAACGSSATSRSTSRPGSADHRAHPELFQAGARRRHAARRLHRQGPAVGQPAVRLAGDAAPRLPLVGRAAAAHVRRSSTSRASTTSAASSPTGRCPATRAARAARALEARAGARGVRRRRARARRELPLIAEDLGVITPAVERLRDGLGLPGHGRAPVRLRPRRPGQRPQPVEPRRAPRRLHRHPRPRHRARLVRVALRRSGARWSTRDRRGAACASAEPWWSLIRLAFASPARVAMVQAQDVLGLGSEARMNVPGTKGRSWRWGLSELPSARPRGAAAGGRARPPGASSRAPGR